MVSPINVCCWRVAGWFSTCIARRWWLNLQKIRDVFDFSEYYIYVTLYDLRRVSEKVDITGDLHVVAQDPDDDKFIECALIAGAAAIVSGDHHLLDLGKYEGIPILSAAEFILWPAPGPAADRQRRAGTAVTSRREQGNE